MVDQLFQERQVGRHAADTELTQRPIHAPCRFVGGGSPGGDLDQQGVVIAGDEGAGVGGAAVEPDAEAVGGVVGQDAAIVGNEVGFRVLGGDAALKGEAVEGDVLLSRHSGAADAMALGDANLSLDQIHARHFLGDGVLDLDARIDLDEIEGAAVGIEQELDGAGVLVAGGGGEADGGVAKLLALFPAEERSGRPLHHLLMPALHRAVALVEMDDVAPAVAENLHLEVTGPAHQLFEIDLAAPAGKFGFAPSRRHVGEQLVGGFDHPHAAAAAAPARLQHQGIADGFGEADHLVVVVGQGFGGRHNRNARGHGKRPRCHLVAEGAHGFGARTDEDHSRLAHRFGKVGVLGQKAVAGMDGVAAVLARHPHDVVDGEVGLHRPQSLADLVAFVRLEAVEGELVLFGIDGDGGDLQLIGRPQHPDRDFASVGDQQAPDRGDGFSHGFALLGQDANKQVGESVGSSRRAAV